jgi:hypothetical protein
VRDMGHDLQRQVKPIETEIEVDSRWPKSAVEAESVLRLGKRAGFLVDLEECGMQQRTFETVITVDSVGYFDNARS